MLLHVHSDSNWAACRSSRKSTSGGTASLGLHTLKCGAKTQNIVAKSSADAELYGAVRAACEGLGPAIVFRDFGFKFKVNLSHDAIGGY